MNAMAVAADPSHIDELSSTRVAVLAVVCALAIATLYYSQPILPLIAASFGDHRPPPTGSAHTS